MAEDRATSAGLAPHLVALPGGGWALWRAVCLRGAGFACEDVQALGDAACAAAADRALAAEDEAARRREEAAAAIRQQAEGAAAGADRRGLGRALRAVVRDEPAGDLAAGGLGGAALAAWGAARQARDAGRQAYLAAWAAARPRALGALHRLAAQERFREAVLWQNRQALKTAVEPFLAVAAATASSANSRQRQHELLVAAYLQRYCTKNDSIGFFGPVGWGELTAHGAAFLARPGPALLAARKVFLEGWGIDALAARLGQDRRLRPWLAPRLWPYLALDGDRLRSPLAPPLRLEPRERAVLAACTGELAARDLARRLVGDAALGLASEAAVFELLETLSERGLIAWQLELPKALEPELALARCLGGIGDEELRRPALAALGKLAAGRDAVAGAAGDAAALDGALGDLASAFHRLTGAGATRAAGATYAGRTLLFEECRRDLTLAIGPQVWSELGPPLGLLLAGARWLTHELALTWRSLFQRLFRELTSAAPPAGAGDAIDLLSFCRRAAPLLLDVRNSVVVRELRGRMRRTWAQLLAVPLDRRRVGYRCELLRAPVEQVFAAPGPGWELARHHSPDLLLAAAGAEAVERGDYQLVLGELHMAINTLRLPLYAGQPLAPAALLSGLDLDLAAPAVLPVLPKAWSTWDGEASVGFSLPATSARLDPGLVPSRDLRLELGPDPASVPRAQALAAGSLVVRAGAPGPVAETRDGRRRFDLVELFGAVLGLQANAIGLGLAPAARHAPRIAFDRLVVSRETWRLPAGELSFAAAGQEADRFAGARRCGRLHGMPRWLFVKTPEEVKPFYVDLLSPPSVEILARAVRRTVRGAGAEAEIVLTEMLPAPDQLWLPDAAGRRYTSELRFVATDLAGRRQDHGPSS